MVASDDEEIDFGDAHLAANRKGKKAGGWQSLGLDHSISKGIQKKGFKQPTPIQRKTIPCILDGKDVVAMSRTGSGKTAAFVIPMLQKLKRRETTGARALLISPSRELAIQTFKVVKELGRFTGLRCAVIVGGDSIEEQFGSIHENPDILIATPGRLLHVIVEMNLRLSNMEYVVFDEADRLFEMGFQDQLTETLKRIPESRQTLLFSATLPKMLVDFAKAGLNDPMLVRLDVDEKISERLSMVFCTCRADEKLATLVWLCRQAEAEKQQTVVFCATMKHVEYVVAILIRAGIDVSFLYSQLDATARKMNIAKFREKEAQILIVTDVAARGVDIPLLDTVINLHFPAKAKLFVHRVGRVARAGRAGRAISLLAPDEIPYLFDLFLFLGKPLKFAQDNDEYKEDITLIGRVPASLVSLEADFLVSIHDNNEDMKDLRHKATNAMSKFVKTRPPPSAESARRSKDQLKNEFYECGTHPYLRFEGDTDNQEVLNRLAKYRSKATIFEVHGTEKRDAVAIMREKRKQHQERIQFIADQKQRKDEAVQEKISDKPVHEPADNELVASTFTSVISSAKPTTPPATKKHQNREAERQTQKEQFFIPYSSADYESEKQLKVEKRDFAREAANAAVDIAGDDDTDLARPSQNQKRWDRKLKRFVGASGDERGSKRMKTEEGTWLPATYRSGRYDEWKKKNSAEKNDSDSEGEVQPENKKYKKHRYMNKRQQTFETVPSGKRGQLKNKDQILKERRKKDRVQSYQKYRQTQNQKKKSFTQQKQKKGGRK